MIDTTRGSKRRLSDADKNERITLRQMVLNMSICKLQKHMGRKEPSLLRSVMVNNTVNQIEREMDMEMIDYDNGNFSEYSHENEDVQSMHADNFFSPSYSDNDKNSVEKADKQILYSPSEPIDTKKENKFGAIGDHRRIVFNDSNAPSKPVTYLNGFMWDSLSLPSLNGGGPILDSLELGNNFNDVDISLYDFDNNFINANLQNSGNGDWRLFPKSCAAEFECRKPDSFFEELDQIMQVLVGM